jgi:protein-S-isoprenylcysteine O-methyltransferase Ste14
VPPPVERTTYVLLASLILDPAVLAVAADPATVWSVTNPAGVVVLQAISWAGWGILFLSTFLINHFELFGLRQVYAGWPAIRCPNRCSGRRCSTGWSVIRSIWDSCSRSGRRRS